MSNTLHLSCECGKVTGEFANAKPGRGDHLHCYCVDCQTAAHYLDKGDAVLDKNGGTPMFVTTPAGLNWLTGLQDIACFRLSPKGPLRWYASCCKTPLVNTTANPEFPFLSIQRVCCAESDYDLLGPLKAGIQAKDAYGDTSKLKASKGNPAPLAAAKLMLRFGKAKFLGEHKSSVMFDAETRKPITEPYILTREERTAARARCGG